MSVVRQRWRQTHADPCSDARCLRRQCRRSPIGHGFPRFPAGLARLLLPGAVGLIVACGPWYESGGNRREFTEEELRLADADPECQQAGTDWECDPAAPLPFSEPVARMRIEPAVTYASPSTIFRLSVRLEDASGRQIPEPGLAGRPDVPAVAWDSAQGLVLSRPSAYGHSIQAQPKVPLANGQAASTTAVTPGSTDTLHVTVTARLADLSLGEKDLQGAEALVIFVPQAWPGASGGGDRLVDRFVQGSRPNVGLLSGMASSGVRDLPVAYTTIAALEDFTGDYSAGGHDYGSAAFLSTSQRFRLLDSPWATGPQTITRPGTADADGLPPEEPVHSIALRIWRAVTVLELEDDSVEVTLDTVLARAEAYTEIASRTLRRNRVGLAAHISETVDAGRDFVADAKGTLELAGPNGPETRLTTAGNYCTYIGQHAEAGDFEGTQLSPAHLDVVFIRWLFARGYACPDDDVILLKYSSVVPTTLAHEIGHHLALRKKVGHTSAAGLSESGFTETNVMWIGESDEVRKWRADLSLGQVFRMNRDSSSYAKSLPGSQAGTDCGAGPEGNENCPCLGLDLGFACGEP